MLTLACSNNSLDVHTLFPFLFHVQRVCHLFVVQIVAMVLFRPQQRLASVSTKQARGFRLEP